MHGRMDIDTKKDFGVLYTHQKNKKSKTWQDGCLRLQGMRAILLDEKGSKLDSLYVKSDQVLVGGELESDRYLITIEEEKAASASSIKVYQQRLQQQPQQPQLHVILGSHKRMPLKRKRTGFTVPRQAFKKLATEDASLISTAANHAPSSVVDQPKGLHHRDPVIKPTFCSTPFLTAGKSKNFRTNVLSVYDGGKQESTSANFSDYVSIDGMSHSDWDPCYPSDLSGGTLQESQTTVTSCMDVSFTPSCFDVETPQMDPTRSSDVCDVETRNNLYDHSFLQNNQPTENRRMGRHMSDEFEQLKENIPNFNLSSQHSMQKSNTSPLKEIILESNNKQKSNITKQSPVSAGRRSASQILALLGKGKAQYKPPTEQPQLESDSKATPKTLSTPASDSRGVGSPNVQFQASEPSFCSSEFSGEVDVMTHLGQADGESTAVSCINLPSALLNFSTDYRELSFKLNKQDKTETTQDESSALSVEQAMYPESMEKGKRSTEVQIMKAAVGRDEIAEESDSSIITDSVEQTSLDKDHDFSYPCRVIHMEEEKLKLSEPIEDGRKQNHSNQEEEKVQEHEYTNEDRIIEDTCRCDHSNRKENRHTEDESENQGDTVQVGTTCRKKDSYCSERMQASSVQNKGYFKDINIEGDSCMYFSNRKQDSCSQVKGKFNKNYRDKIPTSRTEDDSFHSDWKRDSCRDKSHFGKDKIQDGSNEDDRDHGRTNQYTRNHTDVDGNISTGILEDRDDDGQGNCNNRDEDTHFDSDQDKWSIFPRTWENCSRDDGKQESWSKNDTTQYDRNYDHGSQKKYYFDDRNQDEDDRTQAEGISEDRIGIGDDRNQNEEKCNERNQDDMTHEKEMCDNETQDEKKCDGQTQNEEKCDDSNQNEEKCGDRNQNEEKCDDQTQDEEKFGDRNQDEEKCDDRNQDEEKCDDRNQDEEKCDDRNQDEEKGDDRNQNEEKCDDRTQDEGIGEDRTHIEGTGVDRNQSEEKCDDRNQSKEKYDDSTHRGIVEYRTHDEGIGDDRTQHEEKCNDRNQGEEKSDDRTQDEEKCDDGKQNEEKCDDGIEDEKCDDRTQDEEKCDDGKQNEEKCDDGNQNEEKCDDRNQDEKKYDDRNQNKEKCNDWNQDEEKCDDRNQDEETCDDNNQDEEKGDEETQNEEKCDDDGNQNEDKCDDRSQDEEKCDDSSRDKEKCNDSNQDKGKCDNRKNQDEQIGGDRTKDEGNYDVRILVNTNDENVYEKQHETVSLGASAITDAKFICTLCGAVLLSAQEICEECADQIEGGFESSWNSTPETSGNSGFKQLDHLSLQNEIIKNPPKKKIIVCQETPLTSLSTYEFSSTQTTLQTENKDVTSKAVGNEIPIEEWLRNVEPFTNAEEDISDSVVPQIRTLQPRITKQEDFQKLDTVQKKIGSETSDSSPNTRSPIIQVQCVPEQPESSSEYRVQQQDVQNSCPKRNRAVNEAACKFDIASGIGLLHVRGNLEPTERELLLGISQEQKFQTDPALARQSRYIGNPSLQTCSDTPQYLQGKWKGVARRSKQETVSHKVVGSLQVLNLAGNRTGTETSFMLSLKDTRSYPSRLEDLTSDQGFASLSLPLHNYEYLPGSPSLTSRWKQHTSLQDASPGVTTDVPKRCPISTWNSSFEVSASWDGDCYSISPCSPTNMPSPEENVIGKMKPHFPKSVGFDSLSDCQKGRENQMLKYGGTVGIDSESQYMGTAWSSEMPKCEETESVDGVYAQWNPSPSLQSRRLSSRCWPMFPGYSQQYAELDARYADQPEVPVEKRQPEYNRELKRLDHDWVMEISERDPSSGLLSSTQEPVDGRHPRQRQSFNPEESGMPPHSRLKRRMSDDVSNTSEGSFPRIMDKEAKKKKTDNYWHNPVSSGTVRRGMDAPTIVQAKARREVPVSVPIDVRHQVPNPYWMQEEDICQDEYLRCKTYHELQETSQQDGFKHNSPNFDSGSVLKTVDEYDIGSPIHPTPDTNFEFGEFLSSGNYNHWSSDYNLNRSSVCDPYLSEFTKKASLEVNEDPPYNLEDLSHTEASTRCQMLETQASICQQFHPTFDTNSVTGAERNLGSPHMKATSTFGATEFFPREDSASAIDGILTSSSGRGRAFQSPTFTVNGQTALSSGRSVCGDLFFPSAAEIQGVASLQRQVHIPASFSSIAHYKQVLTSALKEHLNIILFELSQRYHLAKDKADVQHLDSSLQQPGDQSGASASPQCDHGNPAKMVCVKKEGANKGRFFYACSAQRANQCKFFMWADKFKGGGTNSDSKSTGSSRPSLRDPTTATMYFRSHNINLYYGCSLQKRSNYSNLMPGAPTWIRKHKQQMLDNTKKKLYLRLSRKESSSCYGKEDIWVISKDLTFDPRSTFLVRSVYHGPSSNNDVEIEPLYGYSTSNWTSSCTVHALLACNASSELTCLNNLQEYTNARSVPILPFLLGNRCDEAPSVVKSRLSAFKSPARQAGSNYRSLGCSTEDIEQIATDMIERHKLNPDQAAALRRVALMFQQAIIENTSLEPITLIHGVFGAGKSFLLGVTVLFLLQLFEMSDALHPSDASQQLPWKILIASTTNVAVDRILLGLLQLGFEDFIRVGSIRKIAKPVLPYSVHASDKINSQEIRDLYEMLKTDLTPAEKHHVRRSIERQRLGRNKDLLGSVRVVGVTCAACTFPCMCSLKFPVILLDECSQMTEPSSLLPIARFECEKLVLVGDPKQLDPTIQGSEAAHRQGLEQTLFNRLILLGCEPILLRTQYRCHPTISAIANCLFYDQRLIDGVSAEDRPPLAPIPTLCFYSVSSGKECCASDGSYYNDQEASFVIFLIETLVLLGVEPADIGIITLYKAQTVKINILLQASKLSTQNSLKAIQVSTVDAFQGGEKGVIILSCVRTDYMGFADSDKRTNVALTRSKNHLLIVGNLRILSANSLWGKVIDQCKDAENGIQSSQAFIKNWKPKLEDLAKPDTSKDQTQSQVEPPPEDSPNFSPASEVEDSVAQEVPLPSPHHGSPSYSPLSEVEESEGDTSLNANEQMPCFHIGDLQDILD